MREILSLPELTPLEETPTYVRGVLNLRGRIVPVIDLNLRFGRHGERYQLSDCIIVLEHERTLLGLIANGVENVHGIDAAQVEPAPTYGSQGELRARFLSGLAKVDEQVVMLLDLPNVVNLPEEMAELPEGEELPLPEDDRLFCPEATPAERAEFRARARALAPRGTDADTAGHVPMAVARLDGEFFGVELDVLQEFSPLRSLTRVPCCPPHIVGLINLRGEIITLVDVRPTLQIQRAGDTPGAQVMVVDTGERRVGVPVDEVLDVIYLGPADVAPVPAALEAVGHQYLKGMAPYGSRMLGILDLRRILAAESLVVNEEP